MEELGSNLQIVHFLLFVIPGFTLIWSYRYFKKNQTPLGEFEYASLSFIWGFILVLLTSNIVILIINLQPIKDPYGYWYFMWFTIVGFLLGLGAAKVSNMRLGKEIGKLWSKLRERI